MMIKFCPLCGNEIKKIELKGYDSNLYVCGHCKRILTLNPDISDEIDKYLENGSSRER